MKSSAVLLVLGSSVLLSACVQPAPPPPEPVVINHYETRRVYVPERKYAPSSPSSNSAEGFRAVEQPGSYSQ